MNKYAANSLLKFLEEPVDGIIAILVTNHFSRVLSTIISRCQVIHLNNFIKLNGNNSLENIGIMCCNSGKSFDDFVNDVHHMDILSSVLDFIVYFEDNGLDVLVFMKNMWYNKIQTRDDNLLAFRIFILFYYDVLMKYIGKSDYVFFDHVDYITRVANLNSIDSIIKKINIIQYGYDMLLANLNINLLIDDIMIRLGDVS